MMRTLFLQAPSFDGFDGGAGARYQMRREIQSFWYPTWLAQPAALIEGSKLVDAPPHRLKFHDVAPEAVNRDLVVLHTSTPSFSVDVRTAEALKALKPSLKIGMIGAKVAVEPEASLKASPAIDFVARNEFDFTIKEVAEGRDFGRIGGLSWRNAAGVIVHNEDRAVLENMDELPFVTPIYKRDLVIENYFSGYLKHPYISFYSGRGCKSRCTFCLWPQTIGGHRYRTRSVGHVIEELAWAQKAFPQVKEFFFDDDTLTDNLPRVEALAREIGKLGIVWSCNAKANVPRATLKILKDNGLRLLVVGYESGNQKILHNIKKGMLVDVAKRFAKDCRELGVVTHGTFILGLPADFTCGAVSRYVPLQAGAGEPLARRRERGVAHRTRHATRIVELPASEPYRNFQVGGRFLQALLLPRAEDRRHRRRNGQEPRDIAPEAARGRRIFQILARAPGAGALKHRRLTCSRAVSAHIQPA